jgi:putative ABC transport system ATP-binding protein
MELFRKLNVEAEITIVLVTHEPDIATYARRMVHFVDGRVDYDGPPAQWMAQNHVTHN